MSQQRQKGFTLLEALIVVAIVAIVAGVSVFNILPALRNARADRAQQAVLEAMRQSRQAALDERRVFRVTFTAPQTVTIERKQPGAGAACNNGVWDPIRTVTLPSDMSFQIIPGMPVGAASTPDNFGTGVLAIDFNGGNRVCFQTDGSATDFVGVVNNGVVYMARTDDLTSGRAISLFGATGRIKSWRLVKTDTIWIWR